ncbi:metallophosphoesterase family protein [Comamonas endophytica]|uniref:metallophosphoesterase family protein n=1 Tax=Comamonas endophytica TaxID=2949090 RepID=UPI0036234CA4
MGGFQFAWAKLNALKEKLGARELIATCGNHDLNSRLVDAEEDPDPKGALQTVQPMFPFSDERLTDRFWSRNFVLVNPMPGVRIVVLNTSAYHGNGDKEHHHGRVSERTITAIKNELDALEPADLNILLCHHHVRPLQGIWGKAPDSEFMKKGIELISTLTKCTATPWLTLHGHRHIPNLEFTVDPSSVVVGASTFSAQIQGRFNQFHLLDVEVDETAAAPLRGTIETWTWNVTGGWQRRPIMNDGEGFPPMCGFGSTFQPRAIVSKIEQVLGTVPGFLDWKDVLIQVPDLKFTTPAHFQQIESLLEKSQINLNRDREGRISQVGRSVPKSEVSE